MKRALMVTAGTAAGLAAALSYTPRMALPEVSAAAPSAATSAPAPEVPAAPSPPKPSTTSTPAAASTSAGAATPGTAAPQPAAAATTAAASSAPNAATAPVAAVASTTPAAPVAASGTFTGSTVSTRYGDVQVAVTVTAGKFTDVTALAFPAADTKSAAISAQVIPVLREATLAAQSAEVATISGATYTSDAWQESVAAALAKAGL